jgi:hypothetical protein
VLWPPTWTWTAGTTLPHVITLHVSNSGAGMPSVWITAPAGTSFALPDLSALGVVAQNNQTMSWFLEENSAYASVDAVAAGIPATTINPGTAGPAPVSSTITMIGGDFTVGP